MNRSPMVSLRGLLSDLLEIPFDDLTDVKVQNPIIQWNPKEKASILDVLAEINHSRIINIELQTWIDSEWLHRSLYYLCKEFTNLNKGDSYSSIKPAAHISIMTYTLFEDHPEFYARYRLINVENNNLYTPNFALNVLDLSQDHMATERDKKNHLDFWAKLFKCRTWEEVRTLAVQSPVYKEVAESMAITNLEPAEVSMARWHDRFVSGMRGSFTAGQESRQEEIDVLNKENASLSKENASLSKENASLSKENASLSEENISLSKKYESMSMERDSLLEEIERLKAELAEFKNT